MNEDGFGNVLKYVESFESVSRLAMVCWWRAECMLKERMAEDASRKQCICKAKIFLCTGSGEYNEYFFRVPLQKY